ncbi:hypothetical protein MTsPCn5_40170 [Croceitalea sp. MTPC5]|uniref:hypothetical protein n=1 Tax=Croceitalea sp. MTPC5 TaxID=3056565 RepID=UPI002B3C7BFD|nr:hypothetical protein MTsPCn5_40170 [Croceitalea sp. MTPC5]
MTVMERKDIYANIGLLATQFAAIEQLVHDILVKIIVRNAHEISDMFGITIIENQTLGKRLGLLKKLNRFDNDYTERIGDLVESIEPKISIRNYFIHGVWSIKENSILIENKKLKYTKLEDGQMWRYGGAKSVQQEELNQLNPDLGVIIENAKRILTDIENYGFEP